MKIYIIEDDSLKAEKIVNAIEEWSPTAVASIFRSFNSGLCAIKKSPPEAVVLDMTLPTYDRRIDRRSGRSRPLGGYDLMCKMRYHGISCPVIVVSMLERFGEGEDEVSFEEMTLRCNEGFPNMFRGSIYYDLGSLSWRSSLISVLSSSLL